MIGENREAVLRAIAAVRNPNQLSLWFCLAGGPFGCLTSAIAWFLLGAVLWMPYWQQLRALGMSADDNGWAMGMAVVPPFVGLTFLFSTLASLIVLRYYRRGVAHIRLVLTGINLIPGLLYVLLIADGFRRFGTWQFPGFEVAIVLIGLSWGFILSEIFLRRLDKLNSSQGVW
jgi:hypothetical protein